MVSFKYVVLAFHDNSIKYRIVNDIQKAKILAKELNGFIIKGEILVPEDQVKDS